MEVRYIEWVDSYGGTGWEPLADLAGLAPQPSRSVGFVLDESGDHVTLVQSYSDRGGDEDGHNAIAIPTRAIRSWKTLQEDT